jgi:hypothetical protein
MAAASFCSSQAGFIEDTQLSGGCRMLRKPRCGRRQQADILAIPTPWRRTDKSATVSIVLLSRSE